MQNKSSNPNKYVFREPYEKYYKDLVNLSDHVKASLSVMMFAGIWVGGRTQLVVMTRDESTEKKGYLAWSYQKALTESIIPIYDGSRKF